MPLRQVRLSQQVGDVIAQFIECGDPVEADTEREAVEAIGPEPGNWYTARLIEGDENPGAPPVFSVNELGELTEGR